MVILMSKKRKKSSIRGSKELQASTSTVSKQGANRQDLADEKITVEDETKREHRDKVDTDSVGKTHADTDSQEWQQIGASSVTAADFQQESNTNTETRSPEQEAEVTTVEIKLELRGLFGKSGKLIERLGNALKKIVKRERDICEEIKTRLKDEIAEGIISARTIELHCPEEWKHKTKPTGKNEKISFSKQVEDKPQQKVAVMQDGKSATVTEKEIGTGLDTSSPQPERDAETGININSDTIASMSYNSLDNSGPGEDKEREDHRKCKNCEILQQKYEQLQSKLQGYEEVVRVHTSIKTAKELYRSIAGYQQFEFSAPFEPLRQHMNAAFNSNRSMNSVWFTGRFNHKTGEVIDVRIGKTIDTDTTETKRDDTSNDMTRY